MSIYKVCIYIYYVYVFIYIVWIYIYVDPCSHLMLVQLLHMCQSCLEAGD
jgi:hypothetical protein